MRSGRAVCVPAVKGTYERHFGQESIQAAWSEIMMNASKDIGRTIDYLEARPNEFDSRKLAYFGQSLGAGVGPIMTAMEPRFKASILVGGGLPPHRPRPEADAFNFVPRVTVPTLMIAGRHDFFFPVEASQKPMFDLLGTAPADKHRREFPSGHYPTEKHEVIAEILAWLDRYLGPVKTR
jgi:dienelactone hydrolase